MTIYQFFLNVLLVAVFILFNLGLWSLYFRVWRSNIILGLVVFIGILFVWGTCTSIFVDGDTRNIVCDLIGLASYAFWYFHLKAKASQKGWTGALN